MKAAPRISEAEWQVMKVLWQKAPLLASEIVQALAASTEWEPATIKTLLNRLVGKAALRFEKVGKTYLYSPACTEEECRTAEADSFLHRVFDGALSPMFAHFVKTRKLTKKELESLRAILREGEEKK